MHLTFPGSIVRVFVRLHNEIERRYIVSFIFVRGLRRITVETRFLPIVVKLH